MQNQTKYLVIGNSTAAVGAVEGIRSFDKTHSISLVSREPYHTYSRPLISYLLAGKIDEDRIYYRPGDFYLKNNVETSLGVAVERIDVAARTAHLSDGQTIAFEKAVIATGGKPFVPKIEGVSSQGVFTFTSWKDASAVDAYIKSTGAQQAVVLGGGLIGVKSAEALRARNLDVTVVELAPRLLPLALDAQGSAFAQQAMEEAGVRVELGTTLQRIVSKNGIATGVILGTGQEVPCQIVIVAVGVIPETSLVAESGITLERGIVVNEHCMTSAEGIYAAGDVAQGINSLTGESRPIPIFPNAYRQGHVTGCNMAGESDTVDSSFAMNSVEFFGLPTISAGLSTAEGNEFKILEMSNPRKKSHKRVILRDGRVAGALFVGEVDRAGIFTGLIRSKIDVSSFQSSLLEQDFGLLSLPVEYRKQVVRGKGVLA